MKTLLFTTLLFIFHFNLLFAQVNEAKFKPLRDKLKKYSELGLGSYNTQNSYKMCMVMDCWGFQVVGRAQINSNRKEDTQALINSISKGLVEQYKKANTQYKEDQASYKKWKKENPKTSKKDYPGHLLPKPIKPKIQVLGSLVDGDVTVKMKEDKKKKNTIRFDKNERVPSKKKLNAQIRLDEEIISFNKKLIKKNLKILEKQEENKAFKEYGLDSKLDQFSKIVPFPKALYQK